jgi:predicted DNA-binding transcriptional regulator AlpA
MRNQKAQRRQHQRETSDDRILSFRQWCESLGISTSTGRRLIAAGEGPPVLQLSARRLGIRMSDALAWQETRVRRIEAA